MRSAVFSREAIKAALRRVRDAEPAAFRPVTWTGAMAIHALYLQETIGSGVRVICGPTLYAEIRRLERMTLGERIAERDAKEQR